jgi:hypothetical protein
LYHAHLLYVLGVHFGFVVGIDFDGFVSADFHLGNEHFTAFGDLLFGNDYHVSLHFWETSAFG